MPARNAPSASDRPALSVRNASPSVNSSRLSVKSSGDLRPATHWNHGRMMRCPTNSRKHNTTTTKNTASPRVMAGGAGAGAGAGGGGGGGAAAGAGGGGAPGGGRPGG